MGAETSILQQCDILEPFESKSCKEWSHHPAIRDDGSKVSVFIHQKSDKRESEYFENSVKYLKILRHPAILKFYGFCCTSEVSYLITESVQPLELVLETLTTAEICAGIHNILEALHFLHDKCGLCHNNISLSVIYVGCDGIWKLGDMEHVCKFSEATLSFLKKCQEFRDEKSIAPEEKEGKVLTSAEYGHARDAYGFGILMQQLLDYLKELDEVEAFEQRIECEFLNSDPTQRLKLNSLLNDGLFKNDFLEILNFLNMIPVKTENEKAEFFKSAAVRLFDLPSKLVASRLGHLLLSRFVLLEPIAIEHFLPHFLTPCYAPKRPTNFVVDQINPLIPVDQFTQYIIPELLEIFFIPESHLRFVLLKYFANFAPLISKTILQQEVLPQLLLGLKDTCDLLVAASLRALADLVPILGGNVVIGGERAKYFGGGKPKFPSSFHNESKEITDISSTVNGECVHLKPAAHTSPKKIEQKQSLIETQEQNGDNMVVKKQQDREFRREEMKKKREERRKKREEDQQILARVEEEKASLDKLSLDETSSINSNSEDILVELLERSAPDGGEEIPEKAFSVSREPSQKPEDNEWSDWEGLQEDLEGIVDSSKSEMLPFNDRLSESGVLTRTYSNDSSDIINNSVVIISDIQEFNDDKSSKGAMKLVSSKDSTIKENVSKSLTSKSLRHIKESPVPSTGLGHDLTERPLGQEFDVLAVEIKPLSMSSEFDFFADMEPVIDMSSIIPNMNIPQSVPSTFQPTNENKLSYDSTEGEASGWRVDDDW